MWTSIELFFMALKPRIQEFFDALKIGLRRLKIGAYLIITGFLLGIVTFHSWPGVPARGVPAFYEVAQHGVTLMPSGKEVDCLALNIYREALHESRPGKYMVAYVTINRRENPRWPNTICDVVYEQYRSKKTGTWNAAFSWTLGSERYKTPEDVGGYKKAIIIAREALMRPVPPEWRNVFYYLNPDGVTKRRLDIWAQHGRIPYARVGLHVAYVEDGALEVPPALPRLKPSRSPKTSYTRVASAQ